MRLTASLVVLCAVSWCIRTVTEVVLVGTVAQGLGHSVHLLAMSLLYTGAYAFCYHTTAVEAIYADLLALTIYKIAWNTFKVFAAGAIMLGDGEPVWSTYSIMGSIVSYLTYGAVCVVTSYTHHRVVKKQPDEADIWPMLISYGAFLCCQITLEFCGRVFTADTSAL